MSGSQRSWSFAELAAESDRWAVLLLELGVKPGEPVAYQLPNMLEFVAISLAAMRIGAVCEPLMPIFREHELEFMLGESGARVLFVPRRSAGTITLRWQAGRARVRRRLNTSSSSMTSACTRLSVATAGPGPRMTAQLLFTSGTTGEPKGVLQTHASLNEAAAMHIRHFGLTNADVIHIPSPLAHQTGFLYGMWIALTLGAPR